MVQWSSAQVCEPRIPGSNPRYSLTTFHSLISPPSGQRVKDYPNYCHTILRRDLLCLYASEAVVEISLASSQHIQERT